jgi:hypothetical protein
VAQRLKAKNTPSPAELRAVEQVVGLLGYMARAAPPRRGEYHAGSFAYYEPGSIHHDFQAVGVPRWAL